MSQRRHFRGSLLNGIQNETRRRKPGRSGLNLFRKKSYSIREAFLLKTYQDNSESLC